MLNKNKLKVQKYKKIETNKNDKFRNKITKKNSENRQNKNNSI